MREVKKAWLHEVLRQKELRTSDYARDMNLSPATVSGMLGGHRAVSDDTVDRTCAFYKVAPPSPIATAAKGGLPLAVTVDQHGEENGRRLGGRFNAAKPLLYEVPTYLR